MVKINKREKSMPFIWGALLLILVIELGYTIFNQIDYEKRKDSGNERWAQVEERIKQIEECCNCGRNG